ncbi:MAG: hypothetical protein HQL69_04755 [Magnetococcales bacterium]|nr:hypothetical protein [Magnetococcales bacterium]
MKIDIKAKNSLLAISSNCLLFGFGRKEKKFKNIATNLIGPVMNELEVFLQNRSISNLSIQPA